eukprot:Rhum_TRINITY_DN14423_c3_g1::Rhum_TRINITY_DN14423_c3_g1_i1::g.88944::m.88944
MEVSVRTAQFDAAMGDGGCFDVPAEDAFSKMPAPRLVVHPKVRDNAQELCQYVKRERTVCDPALWEEYTEKTVALRNLAPKTRAVDVRALCAAQDTHTPVFCAVADEPGEGRLASATFAKPEEAADAAGKLDSCADGSFSLFATRLDRYKRSGGLPKLFSWSADGVQVKALTLPPAVRSGQVCDCGADVADGARKCWNCKAACSTGGRSWSAPDKKRRRL